MSKFLLVFFMMTLSLPSFAEKVSDEFLLKKGWVGKIKIGDDIATVAKAYTLTKETELFMEGEVYPAREVYLSQKDLDSKTPAFVVEESKGKIYRVDIKSDKFRTKDKVGIGSTLGKLKKHYQVKLLEGAEMGPVHASTDELNMSFVLGPKAESPKKAPSSTEIISVLAY